MDTKIKVLDLFSGCGGISVGFAKAGFRIIASIDIWDKACMTLRKNFNHTILCKNLTEYSPPQFCKDTCITEVDIITGGVPCQGFSMAGKRELGDPRNNLFKEFVKYIEFFKPKIFVMENVVGILSMKKQDGQLYITEILADLRRGYQVNYFKMLSADYEVPQNRKRVIFIGFRNDLGIQPTIPPKILNEETHIGVGTILLPENQIPKRYFLSDKAIAGIQRKKEEMKEKKYGFGAQYLKMDKPSYTIPARYYKDGYDALVKYSDTKIRRLTELEIKRIQSFPDNYLLYGNKQEIIQQLGNAVPVKMSYHIAKHLKKILDKI